MTVMTRSLAALLYFARWEARFGVEGFVSGRISPLSMPPTFATENIAAKPQLMASSYDIDSDGEAEQHIGAHGPKKIVEKPVVATGINGATVGRYDDLIAETGLEGKLRHVSILPDKRKVSSYDVFCNRELKQERLAAVGFDMDYTLAQYQQPAFDKLAFDGAKEKLVYKLGYPKEVLDFEYDHEVCIHSQINERERKKF